MMGVFQFLGGCGLPESFLRGFGVGMGECRGKGLKIDSVASWWVWGIKKRDRL